MESNMTGKALPRLSVLVEESTTYETASSVVALLPLVASPASPNSPQNTYVAVATHPKRQETSSTGGIASKLGSSGPLTMTDLLEHRASSLDRRRTTNAASVIGAISEAQLPVLQLCLYSLRIPNSHARGMMPPPPQQQQQICTEVAPDMMLLQTVDLRCSDLELTSSLPSSKAEATSPLPATSVVVEQIAWVGVRFLAVKTRQRQLFLVQSGLTGCADASLSSGDISSEDEDDSDALQRCQRPCPVRKTLSRVSDFATVTTCGASVLFVAGLQHVDVVVMVAEEKRLKDAASPSTSKPNTTRSTVALHEHSWKAAGPFTKICAVVASPSSQVIYLCGTSASHSVDVYRWMLDDAAPPVCVHHVLTTPGHFFYAVSASMNALAPPGAAPIDVWILCAVAPEKCQQGPSTSMSDGPSVVSMEPESLPALRGLDGNYLQVEPTASPKPKEAVEQPPHSASAHRTLNSLWHSGVEASAESPEQSDQNPSHHHHRPVDRQVAAGSLAPLESLVSLRISAPRFLPTSRCQSSPAAKNFAPPSSSLAPMPMLQRYVLHLGGVENSVNDAETPLARATAVTSPHSWKSEMLSLNTPECRDALQWLGEEEEDTAHPQGTTKQLPSWRLDPVVVSQLKSDGAKGFGDAMAADGSTQHALTLHTSHRVVQLCVELPRAASSSSNLAFRRASTSSLYVQGKRAFPAAQNVVGLSPIPSVHSASLPLLLLSGVKHIAGDAESFDGPPRTTVYGQKLTTPTLAVVTDIQASLVLALDPWTEAPTSVSNGGLDVRHGSELLAVVREMVAAEGERLQRHFDARMDRIEDLLRRLTQK